VEVLVAVAGVVTFGVQMGGLVAFFVTAPSGGAGGFLRHVLC
jgi:hypothetical protein